MTRVAAAARDLPYNGRHRQKRGFEVKQARARPMRPVPSGDGTPLRTASLVGLLLATAACTPDAPSGDLWGRDSAAARCVVCHSLEKNGPFRVAPNLWDIVGAPKARERDWYSYSPGLIAVGGAWTPSELDRFLADPAAFAPGTRMNIRVTDPDERARIVELLEKLRD